MVRTRRSALMQHGEEDEDNEIAEQPFAATKREHRHRTPRPLAGEVAERSDAGEGAGARSLTRRFARHAIL
jgi:hypothetical protein